MSNIAYIRVSSEDQNTSRQEELFGSCNIDKYYMEKASGKNIKDRPELLKMMDYVREVLRSMWNPYQDSADRCRIFLILSISLMIKACSSDL